MATTPLNDEQKSLNKLIKKRYSGFKSFTYYDFNGKVPEAKKILELYIEFLKEKGKIFELIHTIDSYLSEHYDYKYKSMFPECQDNMSYIEARAYVESEFSKFDNNPDSFNQSHPLQKGTLYNIKELFGIDETLANKLLHTDYIKITEQQKQNIEEWCQFDKFVTRIIKYIKKNHPKWEKATKKQKQSLIIAYDLLNSEYFSGKDANLLQFYPEFIDKGYGLNQRITSVAKKLLSYNFPRMTLDIAKKITEQSIKNKYL